MIDAAQLTKSFGSHRAVRNLNLRADKGDVIGLLGPNGAGKTTTMRMMSGYLTPSAGRVSLCGCDMAKAPREAQRHLGYLPEGNPVYGEMTPFSFLRFVAAARDLSRRRQPKAIARALHLTSLEEVAHQRVDTLSKGYRRRVGLAQALLHDPPVLILDEPTDGLDPNQKRRIRSLVRELASEKTILISTHILEEVLENCARILVMGGGRVLADGTAAALMARSAYHQAVSLRIAFGDEERARAALGKLEGVARHETRRRGDSLLLTLFPREGAEPFALARKAREAASADKIPIAALQIEEGRLDDLFHELTKAKEKAR